MTTLTTDALALDPIAEADRLAAAIRRALRDLHRRGLVVATSGGVDSSVCAALAVRAVGAERVFCVALPERDSSSASLIRARALADVLGVALEVQDITRTLDAIGCYERRDAAVRRVFPEYTADLGCKIAIHGGLDGRYNTFHLVVGSRSGGTVMRPLPANEFFEIVAATNYKQRVRKTVEYYHADRLNFAVVGTPNRLEFDQGFFVKNGDGAADIKPIAHLYKTQVYAIARALGLPASICDAEPTTDTYSLTQGQDEFFFALPHDQMDYALWARDHDVPPGALADFLGIPRDRAEWIYRDIDVKRTATRYLHQPAVLAGAPGESAG